MITSINCTCEQNGAIEPIQQLSHERLNRVRLCRAGGGQNNCCTHTTVPARIGLCLIDDHDQRDALMDQSEFEERREWNGRPWRVAFYDNRRAGRRAQSVCRMKTKESLRLLALPRSPMWICFHLYKQSWRSGFDRRLLPSRAKRIKSRMLTICGHYCSASGHCVFA